MTKSGQTRSREGQLSSRPVYAVDWDKGGLWVTSDGQNVEHLKGTALRRFVEDTAPAIIYLEPTFESASWEEHNAIVDLAQDLGTELLAVATRASGRQVRLILGLRNAERTRHLTDGRARDSNEVAALAIWDLAHSTYHCKTVGYMEPRPSTLTRRVIEARQHGYQDEISRALLYQLPAPRDLEGWARDALTDGADGGGGHSAYASGFVVPLCLAAEQAESRDEFDRLVGAYGHGYPSVFRSNFYYSRVVTLVKRRLRERGVTWNRYGQDVAEELKRATAKEVMVPLRRATRLIYHLSRSQSKRDPEKGNTHPDSSFLPDQKGNRDPEKGNTHPSGSALT